MCRWRGQLGTNHIDLLYQTAFDTESIEDVAGAVKD